MRTVLVGQRPPVVDAWLEQRRRLGQDLFDELWQGDYHAAPAPHSSHGLVAQHVAEILGPTARRAHLVGSGPLNIGAADDYRVPDGAYLRDVPTTTFVPTAAVVVEIVSPGDETHAKLGFYFAHEVEELLVVDPLRRHAEWYRRGDGALAPTDRSRLLGLTGRDVEQRIDWPPT
ncbi:MAG: Uma2 family endonuclease [Actinomycetota bacterium]|nr:Uma2 family endonuclease [Actinomycetota bacterium]